MMNGTRVAAYFPYSSQSSEWGILKAPLSMNFLEVILHLILPGEWTTAPIQASVAPGNRTPKLGLRPRVVGGVVPLQV